MRDIFEEIDLVKEKIVEIEDERFKEIFSHFSNVLTKLSEQVEVLTVKQEAIEENVGYLGEDLTDIQDELFEEVSFEDLMDIEDEYVEIKCNECQKPLFVEKDALEKDNKIPCPFCNKMAK